MTPNGSCACSDCGDPIPPAPTDHFARLEATDDVWPPTEGAVTVTHDVNFQGVTVWLGDGYALTFSDESLFPDVQGWIDKPLQRAVTVARLRTIAAMLEADTEAAS